MPEVRRHSPCVGATINEDMEAVGMQRGSPVQKAAHRLEGTDRVKPWRLLVRAVPKQACQKGPTREGSLARLPRGLSSGR